MQKLTETFKDITIKSGESFAVWLDSNPSTGYGWQISVSSGKASVVSTDFAAAASPRNVVGAGGTMKHIFKAESEGTIELTAEYRRPWEKSATAEKTLTFKVNVEK